MQERSLSAEETAERAAEAAAGATFAAACLAALGAIAVFSATAPLDFEKTIPPHFLRHGSALVMGAAAAWLASRVSLKTWYRAAPILWAIGVALLIATALAGHSAGGARRWLVIPGLGVPFQPAEFAKLATVLAVAAWLSGSEGRAALTRSGVFGALFMAAIPASLCLVQPDLGNAVLMAGLTGLLLFIGGSPFRILLTPAAVGGLAIARPPTAAGVKRMRNGEPPMNRSRPVSPAINTALPRSGCTRHRLAGMAAMKSAPKTPLRVRAARPSLPESQAATARTVASFANSAG